MTKPSNSESSAHETPKIDTDFLLKLFKPEEDYETIAAWHRARKMEPLPPAALPKLGVMAIRRVTGEPVAASWVYMDCSGTGFCFLGGTVSKPRIPFSEARRAVAVVVGFMKSEVRRMGYSTMITFCEPALARCAKWTGFVECNRNLTMLVAVLGGNQ